MTPGSFDAETARAMVGDMRARTIEASAREHAEVADLENPPILLPDPPTPHRKPPTKAAFPFLPGIGRSTSQVNPHTATQARRASEWRYATS